MKKLPCIITLLLVFVAFGCKKDKDDEDSNYWTKYEKWRKANVAFFAEQSDNPGYNKVYPVWDRTAYILLKYHKRGDESVPSPYLTSTVDVKYEGRLYDGTVFDSSYGQTTYGDSIFRTRISAVIEGWQIALTQMHPGDSCTIIIPSDLAYGEAIQGDILPYSALTFDLKLVDIKTYERPEP
ncbi:MAG: FKBP-type peptidyl-prolyl cis-trans isomerase [Coprobacter sp.]|nr:FKBP-type peptidyl-prolyl cis-trans isomerase [Coprobacter sp.]